MANSLIAGGLKAGLDVSVACPEEFKPDSKVLKFTSSYENFVNIIDPFEAAKDADVLVTDVWASMGEEHEQEKRQKIFARSISNK